MVNAIVENPVYQATISYNLRTVFNKNYVEACINTLKGRGLKGKISKDLTKLLNTANCVSFITEDIKDACWIRSGLFHSTTQKEFYPIILLTKVDPDGAGTVDLNSEEVAIAKKHGYSAFEETSFF